MVNTTEPKKSIKIENIVASTGIGAKLDLNQVISVFEGAEYNKEKFPGVVYRTKSPKTASLIFGSGKIVCTGAISRSCLQDVQPQSGTAIVQLRQNCDNRRQETRGGRSSSREDIY
jgi:TATA-box binding protein (TBP) (component of TFIID and TFIIIB)